MHLRQLVRSSALLSHALDHWRTARLRARSPLGIVPPAPSKIVVEPTNACNLRCTFCGNKDMRRPRSLLDLDVYRELVRQMEALGIRRMTLHTIGEPTLHPDLPEMIRLAKQAGISVGFSTNGTRLNPDLARALVEAGPDLINVSAESADGKVLEQLRPGIDPEGFLEGLRNLHAAREAHGPWSTGRGGPMRLPTIVGTCVITRHLDRAAERAWFERFGPYLDDVEFHTSIDQMGSVSEQSHMRRALLPRRIRDAIYGRLRQPCPYPWDALTLLASGEVSSCHFDFEARIQLGRFPESSLEEIWNGVRTESLRRAHMQFDFTDWEACQSCDATYYVNRYADRARSRRIQRRNGFQARRSMWGAV